MSTVRILAWPANLPSIFSKLLIRSSFDFSFRTVGSKTVSFETFFAEAPRLNPNATKITGLICGYRVEEIEDPLMQKIRYLDKLVDELAKGRKMEKILRGSE